MQKKSVSSDTLFFAPWGGKLDLTRYIPKLMGNSRAFELAKSAFYAEFCIPEENLRLQGKHQKHGNYNQQDSSQSCT